jgi:hypothetical protein
MKGSYVVTVSALSNSLVYTESVQVFYLITRKDIAIAGNLLASNNIQLKTTPLNLDDAIKQAFIYNATNTSYTSFLTLTGNINTNYTNNNITISIDGNNLFYGSQTFAYTLMPMQIVTSEKISVMPDTNNPNLYQITITPNLGTPITINQLDWNALINQITVDDTTTIELELGSTQTQVNLTGSLAFASGIYKITPTNAIFGGNPKIQLGGNAIMHMYNGTLPRDDNMKTLILKDNSKFYNHGGRIEFSRGVTNAGSFAVLQSATFIQDGPTAYLGTNYTGGIYFAGLKFEGNVYILDGTMEFHHGNKRALGDISSFYVGKNANIKFGPSLDEPGLEGYTGFNYNKPNSLMFEDDQSDHYEIQLFTGTNVGTRLNNIGRYASIIQPDRRSISYFEPDQTNPANIKTISSKIPNNPNTFLTTGVKPQINGISGTNIDVTWPSDNTTGRKYY